MLKYPQYCVRTPLVLQAHVEIPPPEPTIVLQAWLQTLKYPRIVSEPRMLEG